MLAGLIHDIGRLPLLLYIGDKDLSADDEAIGTSCRNTAHWRAKIAEDLGVLTGVD